MRTSKSRVFGYWAVALAAVAPALAQRPLPNVEPLSPASTRTVNAPFFPYFGESQCDEDGNLFFHSGMSGYRQPQVFELSRDGERGELFRPSGKFADQGAAVFEAFWVSDSGGVFVAVSGTSKYALRFDRDGTMENAVQLSVPEDVSLTTFAIFDNGSMFVAGNYWDKGPAHREGEGYQAILGPSGELTRELSIPVPDADFEGGGPASRGVASSRGNLYFLGPNRITVISPSGQMVRRIPFDKPERESIATKIYVAGGRIVIALDSLKKAGSDDRVSRSFLVLDEAEGRATGYYKPPDLNWSDVCFGSDLKLVFLTVENKQQRIVTASVH